MPAKDIYHDVVKRALLKDGWTITHDPLRLIWGPQYMYVDLGAERLLAAQKTGQKIAVEIKSFTGASAVTDLERAIGQFVIYRSVLEEQEPDRVLYLAVPQNILSDVFEDPLGRLLVKKHLAQVVGFDPAMEVIVQWIPKPSGA
jgi:XisH protein